MGRDVGNHFILSYRHEKTISFELNIKNKGRWGVTVLEIVFPDESDLALLAPYNAWIVASSSNPDEFMRPFEPFRLGPGQEITVLVRAEFRDCEHFSEGTSSTLEAIFVRYRFLVLNGTEDVLLPKPFEVVSPSDVECPISRP